MLAIYLRYMPILYLVALLFNLTLGLEYFNLLRKVGGVSKSSVYRHYRCVDLGTIHKFVGTL